MADKAYITPKVLKWARETARMSVETASAKIPTSVEKLKEWEEGKSQPTIRQAEVLAKAYKRPFALLFLPDIPYDFTPLQDFRSNNPKQLSTASIFIIREIMQKQAWIKDLYEDNNEEPLPFVGKFSIKNNPADVANDIIRTLGIIPTSYASDNPIKEWINKAEVNGIFISRTSFIHTKLKIDSNELQGFTIADSFAPFVFINSDDWNAPQLFTLVHELAHIWIAESGISNITEPEYLQNPSLHPIELFCNEVAANALMPTDIIRSIAPAEFHSSREVFKIAKTLGVSSYALLYRALNLNIISQENYKKIKKTADTEFSIFLKKEETKKLKQKENKGGPDYYLLQLNKNSRLFTQVVLDAFRSGWLEATIASNLLNTKVNNFRKLEMYMQK